MGDQQVYSSYNNDNAYPGNTEAYCGSYRLESWASVQPQNATHRLRIPRGSHLTSTRQTYAVRSARQTYSVRYDDTVVGFRFHN